MDSLGSGIFLETAQDYGSYFESLHYDTLVVAANLSGH
jgi:hypothetical protein